MTKSTQTKFKIAGLVIILIPIGVLFTFAIAESLGGDLSGLFHLIQAAPFIFLAILAWKRPLMGGWLTLVLASLILIMISKNLEPALIIGVILTAISGLMFLAASRYENVNKTWKDLYAQNI